MALQDAKSKFSEVVQAAADGEPQIVTRRGVETAVVISHAEWERVVAIRRRHRPSFAEYLLEIPTADADAPFERIKLAPRDCDVHPQLATDMLIAATALDWGLTVVTRNVEHFRVAGVPVTNPFAPSEPTTP